MAAPSTFMASGTVPQIGTTKRQLWVKKLATIQGNLVSPGSVNDPRYNDTIWRLKEKAVRAAAGITGCQTGRCDPPAIPPAPPEFDNEAATFTKYCTGGADLGVPACVMVEEGIFSAATQEEADALAATAGAAALFDANPGPCCAGNPLPVTMVRDIDWDIGSLTPAPGATASFAGTPSDTFSCSGTLPPSGTGTSISTAVIVNGPFCNPWPSYDVQVEFDFAVSGLSGVLGFGNQIQMLLAWRDDLSQTHLYIMTADSHAPAAGVTYYSFPGGSGSGHVSFTIPIDQLGAERLYFGSTAIKFLSNSAGTLSFTITNFEIRPLVPPIPTPNCTVISSWSFPDNDAFADCEAITGASGTASGTTLGATLEEDEPSTVDGDDVQHSIWYCWTAPSDGVATFDTNGSVFVAGLAAYTGSTLAGLVTLAEGTGFPASISFPVTSGTAYRIQLSVGPSGTPGASVLNWLIVIPPANDNFADAQTVSGASGTVSGSTDNSSVEAGEPSSIDGGSAGNSIWFKWVAPANGSKTFTTVGSNYDTLLAAYTGASVGALTLIAGNDDGAGISPRSRITFTAVSGTTYYIRVDGYNGDTGNVVLNWS